MTSISWQSPKPYTGWLLTNSTQEPSHKRGLPYLNLPPQLRMSSKAKQLSDLSSLTRNVFHSQVHLFNHVISSLIRYVHPDQPLPQFLISVLTSTMEEPLECKLLPLALYARSYISEASTCIRYDQYLRDTLPYHYLGHYFTNNS